jgi:hypothetical protein
MNVMSLDLRCVRVGLSVLAALMLCTSAQAQWKWRDSKGGIQYSDLPPPLGTPQKDILQRPTALAPVVKPIPAAASAAGTVASAPAVATVDPELEAQRKLLEQQQAAKRKADEAAAEQVRAQNCESARAGLRTLESGLRVARVTPSGEREIIDDATRAQQIAQAREAVASNCR